MKIYNKIIISIETGETLYSEHYNYTGKVALCKGGGGGYPKPSQQELDLLEFQLESLKKMGSEAEKLRPFLLQGMGLKEDSDGNMMKMTETEYYDSLTGLDKAGYDLAVASTERSMKAYAGELDISPALEKNLEKRKEELSESLSRNLGSGWQGTTAGIQAMSQFDESSELIREEVRSGIITNEGGMSLANLGYMSGTADADMASFPGVQSGIFSGAGQMAQHYQQDRYAQGQANAARAQANAQRQAGMMAGIGSVAAAGVMGFAMSSKKLKKNIKLIKDPIKKIKSFRGVDFDWKDNSGHDVGVIAEELEVAIPEAVAEVDGTKGVYYYRIIPLLVECIKDLQKQVDGLKAEDK